VRVLIDTNIVLDFLLQREPFFQDAELLFQSVGSGQIIGYVTATTLTDIFYISRKHTRSVEQARQAVSETLTAMVICPIDRAGLDAILTRDNKGFLSSPISVLSIQEFLQQLAKKN
jgi:predicted nucleic acid-binding protein